MRYGNFTPPSLNQRRRAIGPTEDLPETLQRAFNPARDFKPVRTPQPGDWLAEHVEPGQPFEEFVQGRWNRQDSQRDKIYLQPLDAFPPGKAPDLDLLKEYVSTFFTLEAVLLPPVAAGGQAYRTRTNPHTDKRQILTTDVLAGLKRTLPADAFCIIAISMFDLYPDPAWNFVFGQASLRERVGVYSFARYDPAFYRRKRGEDYEKVLLKRSCKVLVHETNHMFGLSHCIYYQCLMNGSNYLEESDQRPMNLCPVDLRKLHHSIGFDVLERYEKLARFYQKTEFEAEAQWVERRVKWIRGG